MDLKEFQNKNKITGNVILKDGRIALTTHNGFRYWISSKREKVDEVTESQYIQALRLRVTKRDNLLKKV